MKRIIQIKTMNLFAPSFFNEEQIDPQKAAKQRLDTQSIRFDYTRKASALKKSSSIKNKNVFQGEIPKAIKGIEKTMSTKTQSQKRSLSRAKQHLQGGQQRIVKSHSISRYDTRRQTQANESEQCFKSRNMWTGQTKDELIRDRMKTELSCRDVKEEMMKRITNKINFMKRMTSQENHTNLVQNSSPDKSLFKFDKLSDFCLKNINKSLKIYEKDLSKAKDKKYYQLKIEGHILSSQLQQIRNVIVKNKEKEVEPQVNLGVIGNCINVKNQQKSQRINSSHFKKKAKNIYKKIEKNAINPFRMDDMHGWDVGIQKIQDFYV